MFFAPAALYFLRHSRYIQMVVSITASNQRAASDDLVVNSLEAAVFLDNLYKLYITQSMFYKFPELLMIS